MENSSSKWPSLTGARHGLVAESLQYPSVPVAGNILLDVSHHCDEFRLSQRSNTLAIDRPRLQRQRITTVCEKNDDARGLNLIHIQRCVTAAHLTRCQITEISGPTTLPESLYKSRVNEKPPQSFT